MKKVYFVTIKNWNFIKTGQKYKVVILKYSKLDAHINKYHTYIYSVANNQK